jgi:signal transduction histidine kinase
MTNFFKNIHIFSSPATVQKRTPFYRLPFTRGLAYVSVGEVLAALFRIYKRTVRKLGRVEHITRCNGQLQQLMASLAQAASVEETASLISTQGMALLGASGSLLALQSATENTLDIVACHGHTDSRFVPGRSIPLHHAEPFAHVIQQAKPLLPAWDAKQGRGAHSSSRVSPAWAVAPLFKDGQAIGALSFSFDKPGSFSEEQRQLFETITHQCIANFERHHAAQALEEAHRAAEVALRKRNEFLSIASHELRTPFTSLLGQAQLLQRRTRREGNLTERDLHSLQVIVNQAQRANKLVNHLLDVSRIEHGQLAIEPMPIDLQLLLQRTLAESQPTFPQHRLVLQNLGGEQSNTTISGDEVRLEQVFQNLLDNAARYSPHGGIIQIDLVPDEKDIRVRVADHGIGIPESELPFLYERFYRAENADRYNISGMGIGLFVVNQIVSLHGGTIEASSVVGQGSIFEICLPREVTRDDGR